MIDVGALFREHYGDVVVYLRRRTDGDEQLAEDLAMRTFEKAVRRADRFEERGRPTSAWLYTIAHNVLVDHVRTTRPTRRLHLVPERAQPTIEAGGDRQVERADLLEAVRALPGRQPEVIALRFLQGYSTRETARALKLSEDGVKHIRQRALRNLQQRLERAA